MLLQIGKTGKSHNTLITMDVVSRNSGKYSYEHVNFYLIDDDGPFLSELEVDIFVLVEVLVDIIKDRVHCGQMTPG